MTDNNKPTPLTVKNLQEKAKTAIDDVVEEAKNLCDKYDVEGKAKSVAEKAKSAYEKAEVEDRARAVASKVQGAYEKSNISEKAKEFLSGRKDHNNNSVTLPDNFVTEKATPTSLTLEIGLRHEGDVPPRADVSYADQTFSITVLEDRYEENIAITPDAKPGDLIQDTSFSVSSVSTNITNVTLTDVALAKYDPHAAKVTMAESGDLRIVLPTREVVDGVQDFIVYYS